MNDSDKVRAILLKMTANSDVMPNRFDEALTAIMDMLRESRIEERDFAWQLINDIRYQHTTLEEAKHTTLERLTELQVEAELQATEKGAKS